MRTTESQLIAGCIAGDRATQKEFYDTYSPKMYSICLRYLKHTEDAEDALQDGFIRAFKYMGSFRGDGAFEGWLRRIFVSVSIEALRRRKSFIDAEKVEVSVKPVGLSAIYYNELEASVNTLPKGYREAFKMYAIDGYSHKQIGDILGITESTSKSQFCRARKILIKKIA